MCLFGSDKKTNTSVSTPTYDAQTTALKNAAVAKATGLSNNVYQPVGVNDRVAGFKSDQQDAFNLIRSNALNYDPTTLNNSVARTEAAANAGAQNIGGGQQIGAQQIGGRQIGAQQIGAHTVNVEGLMNEGGRLGTIASGMNPYLKQILDPTLRTISEQGAIQRNGIKAGATSAGAFGDARHGVVDAMQMRDQGQQVADTTGQVYKSGWDDTMARRAADRDAFTAGDTFNANVRTNADTYNANSRTSADTYNANSLTSADIFNANSRTGADTYNANSRTNAATTNANFAETALGRMLSGSAQAADLKAGGELLKNNAAQSLLTSGNQQQANWQAQLDAAQEERLRHEESKYRQLDVLQSLISGTPTSQAVTTTSKDGSNGFTKVLGSALGALF